MVVGADGFHGVSRSMIPRGSLRSYVRDHPFGWLGILAAAAPSSDELIYAQHPRGFALASMRSPQITRLYVQCDPADDPAQWPDSRVWDELHARLARDGWSLTEGEVLEKGVTAMRSFVCEPMRHGRLFLAGDAAHIVPPTGAKGLNLAVADVAVLAPALTSWLRDGDDRLVNAYSDTALQRVWRAQDFSTTMTAMMHRHEDQFENRRQRAALRDSRRLAGGVAGAGRELRRPTTTGPVSPPTTRRAAIGLAIGLVAIAVNLRPAIASVGPILDELKRSLGLSDAAASAVTSLPVVCFGLFAPVGAWLSRRVGLRRSVAMLALALVGGMFLRLGPDLATFVAGTLLAAAGIAALNVVTPALVKLDFPDRTGPMMGIYTTALTGAAAAAAGLTVPAEHAIGHGWRGGLAVWAVLAVVGFVVWLPQARGSGEPPLDQPRMGSLVTAYAMDLQSLMIYTDPSAIGLAGQGVVTKIPLCEDM